MVIPMNGPATAPCSCEVRFTSMATPLAWMPSTRKTSCTSRSNSSTSVLPPKFTDVLPKPSASLSDRAVMVRAGTVQPSAVRVDRDEMPNTLERSPNRSMIAVPTCLTWASEAAGMPSTPVERSSASTRSARVRMPFTSVSPSISKYENRVGPSSGSARRAFSASRSAPRDSARQEVAALGFDHDERAVHRGHERLVDAVPGGEDVAVRFARRRFGGCHREEGHEQQAGEDHDGGQHPAGVPLKGGVGGGQSFGHQRILVGSIG